ncbi:MAG: transcriptional regulator [Spirochaetes bacterium GWF1_41_5]|nr:MAG: transcriptional regulator [Spirochaetes bacterium GWF1_41_5]
MKVPLLDLNAQYQPVADQVLSAFKEVFDSKQFIGGKQIAELEQKIAAYCGTKEAVGVSSGTDAILAVLMALEIKPGDEVITTPFTFFATAGCIRRLGAKPVFVDIEPDTYNINPVLIEKKITSRTRAIIPVHIFGQCADMERILHIAEQHRLPVIEDAAQAIGAEYRGKKAGSMGLAGCFSFFPSKNLGACGDGGMITVNDSALAEKLRFFRNHGMNPKYYHQFTGGNFRLDTIQAAILLVKLPLLESWHAGRIKNAAFYNKALAGIVGTPQKKDYGRMIYNQYTIECGKRDELKSHLTAKNIGCDIYYPVPLHLQECFSDLGYIPGDLPIAEKAARQVLSLPVYPELTDEQKEYVTAEIKNFYKN